MKSYSIRFQPKVEKDLKPLPKTVLLRVFRRIIALQNNPMPQTVVKLSGIDDLYRLRVGDYRIVYKIDRKNTLVIIHYIRLRRDVYRLL